MMMDKTISRKVQEELAQYKRDLHTEKYQDGIYVSPIIVSVAIICSFIFWFIIGDVS